MKKKVTLAKAKKKIIKIMKKTCNHAYLATVAGKQPWIRSMSPIIGDDMSIWVTTFAKSRKVKQIKKNPRVCLHFVKHPDGSMAATVHGKVKVMTDLKDKKTVWKMARFDLKQFFPKGPGSKDFCLLKIFPEVIEWWDSWESGRNITKV